MTRYCILSFKAQTVFFLTVIVYVFVLVLLRKCNNIRSHLFAGKCTAYCHYLYILVFDTRFLAPNTFKIFFMSTHVEHKICNPWGRWFDCQTNHDFVVIIDLGHWVYWSFVFHCWLKHDVGLLVVISWSFGEKMVISD